MSCRNVFSIIWIVLFTITVIVILRTISLSHRKDDVTFCKSTDMDYIKATNEIVKRFQDSLRFKTVSTKQGDYNREQLVLLNNYLEKS